MTLQCLESIAKTCATEITTQSIEIIVVDNHSEDETATALAPTLARLFGTCGKALSMPQNLGFAKACNAGAKAANHPLIFFLNNDTILTQGWLPPLILTLENNPKIGMVGPLLLYPDNTVQHCGICITPTSELEHLYHSFPSTHPAVNKQRILQAITAAALLMPKQLFFECGGFCEDFVNGFEDIDLCCAVRDKGLFCTCVAKSHVYHLESQTPGRFENDANNASLLQQRRKNLELDYHSMAAQDGFIPKLSPALKFYITLPEAKEQALNIAFTQNFDLERCQARLYSEPLWLGGYELMANYFEDVGKHDEALQTWLKLTNLAPIPAYLNQLERVARQVGQMEIASQATNITKAIAHDLANPDALLQRANYILQRAIKAHDDTLKNMAEQWLMENKKHY